MAKQTVVVRTGGSGIDTRDFHAVSKALRIAAPQVGRDLKRGLRAGGEIMATRARSIAQESSQTIPGTIKVRTVGATVAVVAGGKDVPIASLFELGNIGNKRKSAAASRSGVFRHPVFGDREAWVNQQMHPFLAPAAEETAVEVEVAVVRALDEATRVIVFGGH